MNESITESSNRNDFSVVSEDGNTFECGDER